LPSMPFTISFLVYTDRYPSPIMMKVYGAAGGPGGPGGFPGAPGDAPGGFPGGGSEDGPSVEEVD
jgi:heat shock protein 1/8